MIKTAMYNKKKYWFEVPQWAEWIAFDKSGNAWWYSSKPVVEPHWKRHWMLSGEEEAYWCHGHVKDLPNPPKVDWDKSLRRLR